MRPDKETIIKVMDNLEAWISVRYFDCSDEAHEEHDFIIKELRMFLGFDDEFLKLKIKW